MDERGLVAFVATMHLPALLMALATGALATLVLLVRRAQPRSYVAIAVVVVVVYVGLCVGFGIRPFEGQMVKVW